MNYCYEPNILLLFFFLSEQVTPNKKIDAEECIFDTKTVSFFETGYIFLPQTANTVFSDGVDKTVKQEWSFIWELH
jgi:hypothetical protein